MLDNEFRIRFTYSKRGRSCFVPHVVIPQVFYRAMRRSGLQPLMSQGFSPRPRITLGPALPVGIVGICEPAETWFADIVDHFVKRINPYLPMGFQILSASEADGPSLNKQCNAASYLILPRENEKANLIFEALTGDVPFRELIVSCSLEGDAIAMIVTNPCGFGPSAIIKYLQGENIIRKWSEICLVRNMVGKWTGSTLQPML